VIFARSIPLLLREVEKRKCASLTHHAMARRQRMAILSARGRWGRLVRLFAPGLIDRIAARAVREGR